MQTALVVVDVQVGCFYYPPYPHDAAGTICRINQLASRARVAGIPVIYIQHESPPEDGLEHGTPDWALHPDLDRQPEDHVVAKTMCDAFGNTKLKALLDRLQVQRLVFCGYASDFCVDSTVRRAATEGYDVTVAADAHTSKNRPVLKAVDIIAHHNWVWSGFIAPIPVKVLPAAEIVLG